ncbi:uncharacterized protein YdhG (YjbR/CyaY superfamily) [Algoriphagus sp. 4150]|uniref:iron chaperone n=1 Tax=Algoriphagus sp. 4150 TaxID=2817756 RepID=UPI002863323F|nr:DUF1801 domain-containing protein [Algoriphagus sp. 4150]MDR7128961.1 uncharacterized protein YdhG (YjbR/CyaY superfamily) [Algoriphagus sp. 4150]
MKDIKPTTIEEYIDAAPREFQGIMYELAEIIKNTIPKAEGGISWNVPIYNYHGILAGFDVAKKHVSFGIDALDDEVREILKKKGYKTGKKTIQIKPDQKVPKSELIRLIKEQAKLNEVRRK